jgi:hypothetical protein
MVGQWTTGAGGGGGGVGQLQIPGESVSRKAVAGTRSVRSERRRVGERGGRARVEEEEEEKSRNDY